MTLTITVVVPLKHDGDPKLVHHVPPNEHENPSHEFEDASDNEKLEPVPSRTGGRKQGADGRNHKAVCRRIGILTDRRGAGGLFRLGGRHESSEETWILGTSRLI
jgi:hypothetical protein